jgi:hypothetical protein
MIVIIMVCWVSTASARDHHDYNHNHRGDYRERQYQQEPQLRYEGQRHYRENYHHREQSRHERQQYRGMVDDDRIFLESLAPWMIPYPPPPPRICYGREWVPPQVQRSNFYGRNIEIEPGYYRRVQRNCSENRW